MPKYDDEMLSRATRILREKNEKGILVKSKETKQKEKEILDAYKKHKQVEKNTGPIPLTPKQEKFVDIYCSRYGEWSARRCAIAAGYGEGGAHTRANELLDAGKNPNVVLEINSRLAATREEWDVNRDKHLAMLTKIRDEARVKGQYGVVAKCEELRGKVAGLYIEKQMVLQKDVDTKDIDHDDFMKEMFPTREAFDKAHLIMGNNLYGEDSSDLYKGTTIEKTEKELEDERLGKELDEYQEMRRKEREKQYKKR